MNHHTNTSALVASCVALLMSVAILPQPASAVSNCSTYIESIGKLCASQVQTSDGAPYYASLWLPSYSKIYGIPKLVIDICKTTSSGLTCLSKYTSQTRTFNKYIYCNLYGKKLAVEYYFMDGNDICTTNNGGLIPSNYGMFGWVLVRGREYVNETLVRTIYTEPVWVQ